MTFRRPTLFGVLAFSVLAMPLTAQAQLRYERIHTATALLTPAPKKSAAVLPLGATIAQGGAISGSPQTGPTTGPINRGRA